jgi:hypothetical protein
MSSEQDATLESDELSRMLTASEALDADVHSLLESGWNTSSQRHVICMAYCKAAVVHSISQRVLIEDGLRGTALSLIRIHFETVVRAAWVLHGAKDDWLMKFSAPIPLGDLIRAPDGATDSCNAGCRCCHRTRGGLRTSPAQ